MSSGSPPPTGPSTSASARLLVPDGLRLHAPMPALATAAAVVPGLRVGPFVLAAPLRPARAAAWEGHSMSVLTDARFDFGIGTGRPDARGEVEQLGRPWGSGAQRLAQLQETVAHLRELDGEGHTPVLVAAGGPRALAFAAAEADIVTLAARRRRRAGGGGDGRPAEELAGPREPGAVDERLRRRRRDPAWMAGSPATSA